MTDSKAESESTGSARIDATYYDQSGYFDRDTEHLTEVDSPFQRYRVRNVLKITPFESTDRVVDLGCGWGTFCFALAPHVREITGVDFSARSIEICERRAREIEATGGDPVRVSFLHADARATGLDAGSVDRVVAADLFEHLYPEDSQAVVDEAFRILRPGGTFAIWTPHRGHILEILKNRNLILERDESHVDYKSMDRLHSMLRSSGFVLHRSYYVESHLPVLRRVERATLRFLPFMRRRIAIAARKPSV